MSPPGATPRAVLVLGMHRSGTSALAGALAKLGLPLGSRMVEAQPDNPGGYWEHADAVLAHEALLLELGRGWDDLRPLPAGWLDSAAGQRAAQAIDALVDRDFAQAPLWVLKDPRACRLLPLWRRVLAGRGIEPLFLFSARAPAEVVASLRSRDGLGDEHAQLLWAQHLVQAEQDSRGAVRAMLSYERLLDSPVAALDAAGLALGLDWPIPPAAIATDLRAFLDPGQRHQRAAAVAAGASGLAAGTEALHQACLRIAAGQDDWASVAAAQGWLAERIAASQPWAEGLATALNRSRGRLAQGEARLAETESALEQARALSLQRMQELQQQGQRLEQVHAALEQAKALSVQRLDELAVQAQRLDAVHGALDEAKALSVQRLDELAMQARRLDEVHAALDDVKQLSLERLGELQAAHRQVEDLQGQLVAATSELGLAQARLAEAQTDLANSRGRLAATEEELAAQRARADHAEAQVAALLASLSWRLTRPLRWLRRKLSAAPRA